MKVNQEVRESLESSVLVGRVYNVSPGTGPIIVAAYALDKEPKEIAHYTVLHDSGEFELMVNKGTHYIFAYQDTNSNLIYEAGESAGHYGDPTLIDAPAGGSVHDIDFIIPDGGITIDIPHGFNISPDGPKRLHSRLAGAVIPLDDELFSEENGRRGFWESLQFYKEIGGSISFLEEYDPDKIPILFIHGAGGTPKSWEYFTDNIDRTRFQPWFFYYPSGTRIQSMAYLLSWKLFNLQMKYKFSEMYITAHSMGGLVARSFIIDHGRSFPCITLFISLATPWGGEKMAEYGVEKSPAVIQSWIDMQPEGEFISSLYATNLPENIRFYMFYGHRGSRNPLRSNNDGSITLSSLLDTRPQSEAQMSYGFNEDHTSILQSKEVLEQYNSILAMADSDKDSSLQQTGGYIKLDLSYNHPSKGRKPWRTLVLCPTNNTDTVKLIYLSDHDHGKKLGPFPPGDYHIAILSMAAKAEQPWREITIESNSTSETTFTFVPDGILSGYITASGNPEDRPAGMPAKEFLTDDDEMTIHSITVEGPGVYRSLHPAENENNDYGDSYIVRKDVYHDGQFYFFGLPAGTYTLTIDAEGYKTHSKEYEVVPGTYQRFKNTVLEPENTEI